MKPIEVELRSKIPHQTQMSQKELDKLETKLECAKNLGLKSVDNWISGSVQSWKISFLHEYHQNIQRELWNFVKRHNDRSSKSAKPYFSPLCFFVEHHMNDLNLSKNNFHVEKKISTLFSKAMTSLVGSALRISIDKIHAMISFILIHTYVKFATNLFINLTNYIFWLLLVIRKWITADTSTKESIYLISIRNNLIRNAVKCEKHHQNFKKTTYLSRITITSSKSDKKTADLNNIFCLCKSL